MILETGEQLYREIVDRGLDPRPEGRDNPLYHRLKAALGCPADMGLLTHLKSHPISALAVMQALLAIAEPFSMMYSDIYRSMRKFGARRATESIRIKYVFGKEQLDFAIQDFLTWVKTERRIRKTLVAEVWTVNDYWILVDVLSPLAGYGAPLTSWRPSAVPLVLPVPVSTGDGGIDDMLDKIHRHLEKVARQIENAQRHADLAGHPDAVHATLDALDDSAKEEAIESQLLTNATFVNELFPRIVGLYIAIVASKQRVAWSQDDVNRSLRLWSQLWASLDRVRRSLEVPLRELLPILELPFWQYRWYVFEIWTTVMALDALSDFGPALDLDSGDVLALRRGSPSRIASFDDATGRTIGLFAQTQTKVTGVPDRKAISPDLRVAIDPCRQPDQTLAIVECKQRVAMAAPDLERNISLYEAGAPESRRNIFVNCDKFPPVASQRRTSLLSDFRPASATVRIFRDQLQTALSDANVQPSHLSWDVLLLDVSGSMAGGYGAPEIMSGLRLFLDENPKARLFFFNDDLIDPGGRSGSEILADIQRHIRGGTNLGASLTTLRRSLPHVRRVVVVTDGGYTPKPLENSHIAGLEIKEVLPAAVRQVRRFVGSNQGIK